MRKIFYRFVSIWFLLVAFLLTNITMNFQLKAQDALSGRVVELDQDCKLVFEAKFDSSSISTKEFETGLIKTIKQVQELIPADSLTIHVRLVQEQARKYVAPHVGATGWAEDEYKISLMIDRENTNFKPEFMYNILAHEIHHSVRYRYPGAKSTLLECLVLEGLAPLFEEEVFNCDPPDYTQMLKEEEIKKYLKMSESYLLEEIDFEQENNLFEQWFFSAGEDNQIPFLAGYSLGRRIIENYFKEHPGETASSLVFVPAEEIAKATFDLEKLGK